LSQPATGDASRKRIVPEAKAIDRQAAATQPRPRPSGPVSPRVAGAPLSGDALGALFADIDFGRRGQPGAVWSGAVRSDARMAERQLSLLVIGEGLLRAPPRGRRPAPVVSAQAVAVAGPGSPADALSPARVLAARGWETPALLRRAAAARRVLVAARVGGAWWQESGGNRLPRAGGLAVVCLADPPVDARAAAAAAAVSVWVALRAVVAAAAGSARRLPECARK
jgi:hypothetical protein